MMKKRKKLLHYAKIGAIFFHDGKNKTISLRHLKEEEARERKKERDRDREREVQTGIEFSKT